jgi:ABC-type transporter Mla MlaB component
MSNPKGVALPEHGPSTVVFAIGGPIAREELPSLCERFRVAAEGACEVVCDVGGIGRVDAVAVDALARVTLTARRLGCTVRLRHASDELLGLVAFMGLDGVVA